MKQWKWPVLATLFLALGLSAGAQTGTITGCSGVASYTFALTVNGQTGSATTSAFVGGTVGQPTLLFSGGSVSFRLPGESTTTYLTGVYSGMGTYIGWTTAGSTYQ